MISTAAVRIIGISTVIVRTIGISTVIVRTTVISTVIVRTTVIRTVIELTTVISTVAVPTLGISAEYSCCTDHYDKYSYSMDLGPTCLKCLWSLLPSVSPPWSICRMCTLEFWNNMDSGYGIPEICRKNATESNIFATLEAFQIEFLLF